MLTLLLILKLLLSDSDDQLNIMIVPIYGCFHSCLPSYHGRPLRGGARGGIPH